MLVAASSAGAVRLLPWLLAPEVPLEVCWPFARALGAVAVETAFLIGLPLGFAIAAGDFVRAGEARALLSLGATPLRLAASSGKAALLLALGAYAASVAWGAEASTPGRFAARLLDEGRLSCVRARTARSVLVPMLGVSWVCFPGSRPRVTGALPGSAGQAWFSAASLKPSDDLRLLELRDLRLLARDPAQPASDKPLFSLRVASASIGGLSPWGRPASLPLPIRAALVALSAAGLGILLVWQVIRRGLAGRVWTALLAALPALVMLLTLKRLDGTVERGEIYVSVPLVGFAITLISAPLVGGVARQLRRLAPRHGRR